MQIQLKTGDRINLSCTWGDGPDVCVNIYRDSVKVKGWKDGIFPLDFTGDEAIEMGQKLIQAGERAKEMDLIYADYMEKEENNEDSK